MKNILKLSPSEAKAYFLKEESYCNFDLPKYFEFQKLLDKVATKIDGHNLSDYYKSVTDSTTGSTRASYPSDFENVNYKFFNNKDGRFAWRPFQLIHPALYVSLVNNITERDNWNFIVTRIKEFRRNKRIKCYSLPLITDGDISNKAASITNWWESIEQKSLELAMEYEYVLHTDISDCYGSIYTHSIAWSLHTKVTAKQRRNDRSLIGNVIDKHLQDMAYGQTNGIPQGSVLMDFISEIVLGYADLELTHRLEEQSLTEYHILRYRDDYRIYSNNPQTAELILKHITEILIDLNMRLNAQKTLVSNNIIQVSIKPDKLYWNLSKKSSKSLQSHLLLIHDLATKFSNSGSLTKALDRYYDKISSCKETSENINVLISILVDIVFNNPRTYPIASAILSELLLFISDKYEKDLLMKKIVNRFAKIPNTGHLQIWLQRVTIKIDRGRKYSEILCKKVNNAKIEIWNSKWLNDDFKNLINSERIVNEQKIEDLSISIKPEEVKIFGVKSEYTYSE